MQGPDDLSKKIGETTDAGLCLSINVFRMVYQRMETQDDLCTIAETYRKLKNVNKIKLSTLFLEFILDPKIRNLK